MTVQLDSISYLRKQQYFLCAAFLCDKRTTTTSGGPNIPGKWPTTSAGTLCGVRTPSGSWQSKWFAHFSGGQRRTHWAAGVGESGNPRCRAYRTTKQRPNVVKYACWLWVVISLPLDISHYRQITSGTWQRCCLTRMLCYGFMLCTLDEKIAREPVFCMCWQSKFASQKDTQMITTQAEV